VDARRPIQIVNLRDLVGWIRWARQVSRLHHHCFLSKISKCEISMAPNGKHYAEMASSDCARSIFSSFFPVCTEEAAPPP
jgi:hypothetical protein